jgi:DNA-binding NarL/FixJ family response regulator
VAGRSHAHLSVCLSGSLAGMTEVRAVVAAAHPVVRSVIDLACREADVTVSAKVETALAAIEACRARTPDLLILDLELPDADGFRVLGDLGDEDRPEAILVLSDRADGDLVLRALRLGVRGYVTKAEGLRGLSGTIRRVLAGERVIAPGLEQDAVLALGRFARRAREGAEVAADLTSREQQVLELLSEGHTMRQIATRLSISPRTVETHVAKLYRKLGVRTRVQAVSRAATLGLVEL